MGGAAGSAAVASRDDGAKARWQRQAGCARLRLCGEPQTPPNASSVSGPPVRLAPLSKAGISIAQSPARPRTPAAMAARAGLACGPPPQVYGDAPLSSDSRAHDVSGSPAIKANLEHTRSNVSRCQPPACYAARAACTIAVLTLPAADARGMRVLVTCGCAPTFRANLRPRDALCRVCMHSLSLADGAF